jgi:hypothetical protein
LWRVSSACLRSAGRPLRRGGRAPAGGCGPGCRRTRQPGCGRPWPGRTLWSERWPGKGRMRARTGRPAWTTAGMPCSAMLRPAPGRGLRRAAPLARCRGSRCCRGGGDAALFAAALGAGGLGPGSLVRPERVGARPGAPGGQHRRHRRHACQSPMAAAQRRAGPLGLVVAPAVTVLPDGVDAGKEEGAGQ